MKYHIYSLLLLSGCAVSNQRLAEQIPSMETHELCMLGVKNIDLMTAAVSEIKRRQGNCDFARVQADLDAERNRKEVITSLLKIVGASAGAFQIQPPATQATGSPHRPLGSAAFLEGQSESGQFRYCRYSNGIVTTIGITSICPVQN